MKLALVIGSLSGGGAERVMTILANAWSQRGVEVTVVTIDNAGSDKYKLDPTVRRVSLDLKQQSFHWWQGLANNLQRMHTLREALRSVKPDGVLSFLTSTNILSILAARPLGIPVVVSERSSSSHPIPAVWRGLRIWAYRRAAAVVVQTQRSAAWFEKRMPKVPVDVIANPVQVGVSGAADPTALLVAHRRQGRKMVISLGRLATPKGYDMLLPAFAHGVGNHPDWCLVILGEGPERGRLEAQAAELGIVDQVLFPGFSDTPEVVLRQAEVFVLSSRYEGFPNALLEAMACGMPCVGFDCPTGPAELIEHESNGILVPPTNVGALAVAMGRLMDDPSLRAQLAQAARTSVAVYSLEAILARWDKLFASLGVGVRPVAVSIPRRTGPDRG